MVDHSAISAELGGEDGLRARWPRRCAATASASSSTSCPTTWPSPRRSRRTAALVGAAPTARESPYAHWFDVDWAAQDGRLLLPVLGRPARPSAADLAVDPVGEPGGPDGEPVLRYFDHVLPLRAGHRAACRWPSCWPPQHYELADWRHGRDELNYRRFFDVTTLIGLRVEDPDVFAATHEVLLGLVAEGLIDGLRIDHPDGLADPRGYLRRLADRDRRPLGGGGEDPGRGEQLPADWAVRGHDRLRRAGRGRRAVRRPGRRPRR